MENSAVVRTATVAAPSFRSDLEVMLLNYERRHPATPMAERPRQTLAAHPHHVMSFAVRAPLFVGRQLAREMHRPLREQLSRRDYLRPEFHVPTAGSLRLQAAAENTVRIQADASINVPAGATAHALALSASETLRLMLRAGVSLAHAQTIRPANMYSAFGVQLDTPALMTLAASDTSQRLRQETSAVLTAMEALFKAHAPRTHHALARARFVPVVLTA